MTPLMSLMHDSVGKTSLIGGNIKILERKLDAGDYISHETLRQVLSDIKRWNKELNTIIDTYYKANKKETK